MSSASHSPMTLLKEHTALVASIVSIILGVLGILGYFASTGESKPDVNFGAAQFGTQQSPVNLLPASDTAGPGGSVRVCAPEDLYVWVGHDLADGTAISGEWLRNDLIISNGRVVASRQAPNFWMRLDTPEPGKYSFRASALGASRTWDVTVTC
jgi:hypothetical protein